MAKEILSESKVKKLKAPGIFADGQGLYLRIRPTGSKSWVFIYKRGGKRVELGLGGLDGTAPTTLSDARKAAQAIRESIPKRGEVIKPKDKPKEARTFLSFIDDTIDKRTAKAKNDRTKEAWKLSLMQYAKPLHHRPIAELTRIDVADAIRERWEETPETARRTLTRIAAVFDLAIAEHEYEKENPAILRGPLSKLLPEHGVREQEHHKAVPYENIPATVARLRAESGVAARAVEFIILTACRSGEARFAVWDEFNFDAALWTIPKERMKAGDSHTVPLTERAVAILRERFAVSTSELVFEGENENRPVSEQALLRALRLASEIPNVVTHGLRSSFRDWAGEETEYTREVIEHALAHSLTNKVEAAYRRKTALAKRRVMMGDWARYCGQAAH